MPDAKRDLWDLGFRVSYSQRYCAKRRAFLNGLHKGAALTTALSGSAAFVALLQRSPDIALYASALVAVVSFSDLVFGFSSLAAKQDELYRRFSDLAADISRVPKPTDAVVRRLTTARQEIGKDERGRLAVIEALSYNEELVSRGCERNYLRRVRPYQRILAHLITLPPDQFDPIGE